MHLHQSLVFKPWKAQTKLYRIRTVSLGKLILEYADLFLIPRKMRLTELTGHAPILGHIKTLENADLYLRSRKARLTEITGHAPSLGHIALENADLSLD
jgi:hypothetical protein